MLELSFKSRVVQRQQRPLLQLPEINAATHIPPITTSAVKSRAAMQPRHRPFRMPGRSASTRPRNSNTSITGNHAKRLHAPLHAALQQQQERNRKMKNDQKQSPAPPRRRGARDMYQGISSLQISRPDDQELRKRQVSPQHHERQQQIAQIVELRRRHRRSRERLVLRQQPRHDNHEAPSRPARPPS